MLVQALKAGVKNAACPTLTFSSRTVLPLWEGWLAERVQELAVIPLPPILDFGKPLACGVTMCDSLEWLSVGRGLSPYLVCEGKLAQNRFFVHL